MHYPWTTPAQQEPLTKITPFGSATYTFPNTPSAGDAAGVCFMYGVVPDHTPISLTMRHDDHMELWCVANNGNWAPAPDRHFRQTGRLQLAETAHLRLQV